MSCAGHSVLVPYDGTARSEWALTCAVEHCLQSRARLGIAFIPPCYALAASPWASAALFQPGDDARRAILRKIPDRVSVRFLVCGHPAGVRDLAHFARRLDCDSVLLPLRGLRLRRAERALAKAGLEVLNGHLDPFGPGVGGRFGGRQARWWLRRARAARATQ